MTADRPTTEPRTEAGRELLIRVKAFVYDSRVKDKPASIRDYTNAILAIEAEARVQAFTIAGREALAETAQGGAPRHTWCEHGIRDDANCSRCPEGAAPRAEDTPDSAFNRGYLLGFDHGRAAPRAEGHAFQHDWRGFDQCRTEGCGKPESAHAAPRAEGLDEAMALLREWSKWAHEEASTNDQDALDFIVDSDILTDKTDALLARLSRPSDD